MSSVNRPLYERIDDAISLCFLAAVVLLYFLKVSDVRLYFEHTQLLMWIWAAIPGVVASHYLILAASCILEPYSQRARNFRTRTAIMTGYSGNYRTEVTRDLRTWAAKSLNDIRNHHLALIQYVGAVIGRYDPTFDVARELFWTFYLLVFSWWMIKFLVLLPRKLFADAIECLKRLVDRRVNS
ncbi:hypothetical protein CI102_8299 [Trichoderma harzianum]|nr:hypothetical protein CI102_8299 [Trichoderma harzianum]